MFTGKHHDSPSDVPKRSKNQNTVVLQCGHILGSMGDAAILCTKDNAHEGPCDSKAFQLLRELKQGA